MNKEGFVNVTISIGIVLIMLIISAGIMLYFQVNDITMYVKEEIFYTLQNTRLSLKLDSLATGELVPSKEIIETQLKEWSINVCNNNKNIVKVNIENYYVKIMDKAINVELEIMVYFKPVINIGEGLAKFSLNENVNISLLKYKGVNDE